MTDRADQRGLLAASPLAGRREWIGLAVIALPCMLYSMDLTVLNLAVPSLSQDLKPTSAQLLWIVDIYGFMVSGSLITMGTLGDRVGRRRLLLIGAAVFGAVSVVAAFSTSASMLIATRAILGLAGATLAPSTLSLIRNMFLDARERRVAIGVWISSYSVGAAIGPLVGGVLLEHFWWGSVFLVGVPVMLLLLVLGPMLLPEFRDPAARRIDVISVVLSYGCVLPAIYGLKQLAQNGVAWWPLAAIGAGVLAGIVFVRRQRRIADPLIDLDLLMEPRFGAALAAYTLATFVVFGMFIFIAQYLQLVAGLSPLHAGLWTAPFALAFIVGSTLTPVAVRFTRPAFVMAGGLLVAALGFGALALTGTTPGLLIVVSGFVLFSLGSAPVFTLATDMIVGSAPVEHAGVASAISETGSELGGAFGIAVLGSIGTAWYRSVMVGASSEGLSSEAARAARDTLGGALAVARDLPADRAAALIQAARTAFVESMELSAVVSAVVVVATAVGVAVVLREFESGAGPDADTRADRDAG